MLCSNLTAVVLTLNEEARIERCIESLTFIQRLVVIDSFSTDKTLDIVVKTWLRNGRNPEDLLIITRIWQGFVKTRNESLKWVDTPWVVWVDSDEWVVDDLREELKAFLSSDSALETATI